MRKQSQFLSRNFTINSMKPLACFQCDCNYDQCSLTPYGRHKGRLRSIRDAPPIHYTIKIKSFTMLIKEMKIKFESGIFEAGGYRWRLSIYPKGKQSEDGKNNLSLYLVMVDTSSLSLGWEVEVMFRLFLFNQIRGNYLMLEESRGRRFNEIKKEWGFARFIRVKTFNKSSNGYLVDDACVFGAEVFVTNETRTGKDECLSMIKDTSISKFVWKIENFSKLIQDSYYSKAFSEGDYKWMMKLHTNGNEETEANSLSLFLGLADSATLSSGCKVYTDYYLRIMDQKNGMPYCRRGRDWLSSSNIACGWKDFIPLSILNDPAKGLLVNDTCIIKADLTVLGLYTVSST